MPKSPRHAPTSCVVTDSSDCSVDASIHALPRPTGAHAHAAVVAAIAPTPPLLSFDEAAALLSDLDLDLHINGIDAAVAAPLALELDTNDASSASEQPQRSTNADTHTASRDAQHNSNSSKRKNSTKQELVYLREQVQELEQQLAALRQSSSLAPSSDAASATAASGAIAGELVTSSSQPQSLTAVWEQLAQRQKVQRHKSEVENAKLRSVLEGQLKIATSLEKLLRKRPNASWLETFELDADRTKRLRLDNTSSDSDYYDALADDLAGVYAQLDAVFAATGLHDASRTSCRSGVRVKSDNDHMFIEMVDESVLPFDVPTAAAAVWQVMTGAHLEFPNGVYHAVMAKGDSIHSHMSATLQMRRMQVPVRVYLVVQRINEADRFVLVWTSKCVSEPSLAMPHRISIRERGMSVTRPATSLSVISEDSGSTHAASSRTTIVSHCAPELHVAASATEREHAGVLTDLMMASYYQNLQMIHQAIENILIAER